MALIPRLEIQYEILDGEIDVGKTTHPNEGKSFTGWGILIETLGSSRKETVTFFREGSPLSPSELYELGHADGMASVGY